MNTHILSSRWPLALGGLALLSLAGSLALKAGGPCPECVLNQAAKIAASDGAEDPFARFGPDTQKMEFVVRSKDGRRHRLAACFAPNTPPKVMAAFLKRMRMQSHGAWPAQPDGGIHPSFYTSGRTWPYNASTKMYQVMVSVVPDGTMVNGYVGEAASPSNLRAVIQSTFTSPPDYSFTDYWGNSFTYGMLQSRLSVRDPASSGYSWSYLDDGADFDAADGVANVRGDVRIAAHPIDGPGGLLGYAFFPDSGVGGNIVLDSSEAWGQGGQPYNFWRNVTNHEFGHAIGLEHVCPIDGTKLMEPVVSASLTGTQHDDVRGLQSLYGDAGEPNESAGELRDGTGWLDFGYAYGDQWSYSGYLNATGPPMISRYSLSGPGDHDFIPLTYYGISNDTRVDVVVFPVGMTYADNPQNADGTCATGHTTDSLHLADIAIEMWNGYGQRVAGPVNEHGPGEPESFTGLLLPGQNSYTVHIYSVNSFTGPAMYVIKRRRYYTTPVITSLSPNNIGAGSSSIPLAVNIQAAPQSGSSVVYWNGSPRPTVPGPNGYQFTATIPASDLGTSGTATVQLYNPEIGGGMSNALTFSITTAPATVTPEAMQLSRGRLSTSGNLDLLYYSEDRRMGMVPGFVLSSAEAPVDFNLTATSPFASPTLMTFRFEGYAGTPNLRQTIYLYNYTLGNWEQVDVRNAPTSETSISLTPTGNLGRFVSPISRQIKARVTYKAIGPVTYYPWVVSVDQAIWFIGQ